MVALALRHVKETSQAAYMYDDPTHQPSDVKRIRKGKERRAAVDVESESTNDDVPSPTDVTANEMVLNILKPGYLELKREILHRNNIDIPEGYVTKYNTLHARRRHLRCLIELLHLSLQRGEFTLAFRAFALLVRCQDVDIRQIWAIGFTLLQEADQEKALEYLKWLIARFPYRAYRETQDSLDVRLAFP